MSLIRLNWLTGFPAVPELVKRKLPFVCLRFHNVAQHVIKLELLWLGYQVKLLILLKRLERFLLVLLRLRLLIRSQLGLFLLIIMQLCLLGFRLPGLFPLMWLCLL